MDRAGNNAHRSETSLVSGSSVVGHPGKDAVAVTVVIVDDHVMVAESLEEALDADPKITVLAVANSCADGLEAVRQHRPAVLVLDQQFPDGLGTDMLPELLATAPELKVLLITGQDTDDDLTRAITGGAAGVIPKGKRVPDLMKAVQAVANDEAVVTPDELRRILPRLAGTAAAPAGTHLTARERDVLRLLAAGKGTADVARTLFVAPATVRNHIQSLMNKLGAHSRLEAVAIAARVNMLTTP